MRNDEQAFWIAALAVLYVSGWGCPFDDQDAIEDWLKALLKGR